MSCDKKGNIVAIKLCTGMQTPRNFATGACFWARGVAEVEEVVEELGETCCLLRGCSLSRVLASCW